MANKTNMTLYERIMAYRKLKQEKGDDEPSESPTVTGNSNDRINNANNNKGNNNNNNNNNNNDKNYRNNAKDKRPRKLERSDTGFASVDISQYTNRRDEDDLNRSPSPQPTFNENTSSRQRSKVGGEKEEEVRKKTSFVEAQNVFVSAAPSSLSSSHSSPPSPSSSSKPSSFSTHSSSSSRMCPSSPSISSHRLLSVSCSLSNTSSYEPVSPTHSSNLNSHSQRNKKMVEVQNVHSRGNTNNNTRLVRANTCSSVHTRKREMNRQNWGQQGTVSKKGQRLRKIKAHLKGLFVSGKGETERGKSSPEREEMEIPVLSPRDSPLDQYQLVSSSDVNDLETVMDLDQDDDTGSTVNERSKKNCEKQNSPLEESRPKSVQFYKSDTLLAFECMQEDGQTVDWIRDRTTFMETSTVSKDASGMPFQGSGRLTRDATGTRPGSRILKVKSLEPGYQDSIPSIVDISNKHKKYLCLLRSRSEGHLVGSESGENSGISNKGSQSLSSLDEHQDNNPRDGPKSVPQRSEENRSETSLACSVSSKSRKVRRQSHPMHNLGWGEVHQNSSRNQSDGSRHALELDLAQKVMLRHRILKSIKDGEC